MGLPFPEKNKGLVGLVSQTQRAPEGSFRTDGRNLPTEGNVGLILSGFESGRALEGSSNRIAGTRKIKVFAGRREDRPEVNGTRPRSKHDVATSPKRPPDFFRARERASERERQRHRERERETHRKSVHVLGVEKTSAAGAGAPYAEPMCILFKCGGGCFFLLKSSL